MKREEIRKTEVYKIIDFEQKANLDDEASPD
jgi:hypothetical protein